MSVPPPQPEHFASAPPAPAPRTGRTIAVGVVAALLVVGALADAFVANRRAARAEAAARQEEAAHRSAERDRQRAMQRAAARVDALKKRMHALAIDAGVAGPSASAPDPGASR